MKENREDDDDLHIVDRVDDARSLDGSDRRGVSSSAFVTKRLGYEDVQGHLPHIE